MEKIELLNEYNKIDFSPKEHTFVVLCGVPARAVGAHRKLQSDTVHRFTYSGYSPKLQKNCSSDFLESPLKKAPINKGKLEGALLCLWNLPNLAHIIIVQRSANGHFP